MSFTILLSINNWRLNKKNKKPFTHFSFFFCYTNIFFNQSKESTPEKNIIKDGGSIALYTTYTVYTVYTVKVFILFKLLYTA